MYAILDIETTGGNPRYERITEIAVFIHDGEKVVDEYQTLIHPERSIPAFISELTGITNEMVASAPKFYEIAKVLIELTEGKVIIAHNSSFDYNFIKQEYKNLGYDFKRKTLCTVRLSRKLLPGKKSYSLGKICNELGIKINGRHRAGGDALATVKLFELLLKQNPRFFNVSKDEANQAIDKLQISIDKAWLKKLPESAGVYYFYNSRKEIIYIGKSKNIKQRVLQHLSNESSKRAIEMKSQIDDIDYFVTGSELIALLKESEEIKLHKPFYNRKQRRSIFNYGIFPSYDERGYLCLLSQKTNNSAAPISIFSSLDETKKALFTLIEQYQLCQKLCGLYETENACFHYGIQQCYGACIGKEDTDSYNQRVKQAILKYAQKHNNFFVIDEGKSIDERSVVLFENGKYMGYGFVDASGPSLGFDDFKDCIQYFRDSRDVQQIVKQYLRDNKVEKIIPF